jgi:hypothetical protein
MPFWLEQAEAAFSALCLTGVRRFVCWRRESNRKGIKNLPV